MGQVRETDGAKCFSWGMKSLGRIRPNVPRNLLRRSFSESEIEHNYLNNLSNTSLNSLRLLVSDRADQQAQGNRVGLSKYEKSFSIFSTSSSMSLILSLSCSNSILKPLITLNMLAMEDQFYDLSLVNPSIDLATNNIILLIPFSR